MRVKALLQDLMSAFWQNICTCITDPCAHTLKANTHGIRAHNNVIYSSSLTWRYTIYAQQDPHRCTHTYKTYTQHLF
jgi:hypothetical protein